ncbi:MAG TPA: phosphoribosylformylglycinamidine synthase subunit PurS [Actinomycetota bacterium]|jgi:phosphoribosylformylglycinamidine synthase
MRFHAEVVVRLKEGLLDPQGKAVEDALPHMGWTNVSDVRVGKHIELTVDAEDADAARARVEEIGDRLLANPVIETVEVRWRDGDRGEVEEVVRR